jgi:hypothetical protein
LSGKNNPKEIANLSPETKMAYPMPPPATGEFDTRYSGSRSATTEYRHDLYYLEDDTRGNGIETRNLENTDADHVGDADPFTDDDNNWTASEYHNADYDDAALDVHWALQEIYDYYLNEHSREGWDSAGQKVDAYVHAIIEGIKDNAGYYPYPDDDEYLAFGDGENIFYPLVSLDVVAHEYGHGINDHTTNFGGGGIERSFNEGLSDIWGAVIENYVAPNKARWKMGEEIMRNDDCTRNLAYPDNTGARIEIAHTYGTSEYNNNTGYYYRSGVMSHVFYRLVEGGSGTNGLGNYYEVYGIGIDCAADLIYHSQSGRKINGADDYPEMRTLMVDAAEELFGANSFGVMQVKNAWYAVGVGSRPAQIGISGPDIVHCNTNSTYNLNNLPSQGINSISWSVSSTSAFTNDSGSGSSFTTSADGSGSHFITATLHTNCGSVDIKKKVIVNLPSAEDVSYDPPDGSIMNPNTRYDVRVNYPSAYGVDYFNWRVYGATLESGQGTDQITIKTRDAGTVVSISLEMSNSCGSFDEYFTHYPVEYTGYSYSTSEMSFHPIPADNQLTVSIEEEEQDKTQTLQTREYEYYLYNERYRLVRQFTTDMTNVQIQTNDLPGGFYFLNVVRGNKVWRKKIEVRH